MMERCYRPARPMAPRGALRTGGRLKTIADYVRNCGEGLEAYSDRRAALLLGWSH